MESRSHQMLKLLVQGKTLTKPVTVKPRNTLFWSLEKYHVAQNQRDCMIVKKPTCVAKGYYFVHKNLWIS